MEKLMKLVSTMMWYGGPSEELYAKNIDDGACSLRDSQSSGKLSSAQRLPGARRGQAGGGGLHVADVLLLLRLLVHLPLPAPQPSARGAQRRRRERERERAERAESEEAGRT